MKSFVQNWSTLDHIVYQIHPVQFGFLQNTSTVQQLLFYLYNVFNNCNRLDVIYLDTSKAFDTVCHWHLLSKLPSFNIGGQLLWLWFQAYITNKSQYVSVNNTSSYLLPVESGVPQENILGPLLLIAFQIQSSIITSFCSQIYLFILLLLYGVYAKGLQWH